MSIKGNLTDYLREFEYESVVSDSILSAYDKFEKISGAVERLEKLAESFEKGVLDFEGMKAAAEKSAQECGIHPYEAGFIHLVPMYKTALPYFERVGLSREEWYDSFMDFKWKVREQHGLIGVYGIKGLDWFKRFFTAERIAFGRLQFNLLECDRTFKGDTVEVTEGQTVVTIHIPSDDRTPFDAENRLLSYRRAEKHYKDMLEDGRVIFRCGSWLLNSAHREILPLHSNIRSFLDDFELDYDSFKETNQDVWRIFKINDYNGDPSTLPESSSLMRAYKSYMLRGGKMGVLVGFRNGAEG